MLPEPRRYACRRSLSGQAWPQTEDWAAASWSEDFVDIEGSLRPAPRHRTRFKALWDDAALFVLAELDDPHLWAETSQPGEVVFHDNDFEVFLDPDGDAGQYLEYEVNARGVGWGLRLVRPYREGGPVVDPWPWVPDEPLVTLRGTLNDPTDLDEGWTVVIRMAWDGIADFAGCPSPPRPGDAWRVNFSRVHWDLEVVGGRYRKVEGRAEHNWVWSPQGVVDMHQPERWGWFDFVGPT